MNQAFRPFTLRPAAAEGEAALDAYVRAHPQGTPFHLSSWRQAVARGCGQRAHGIVAEQGARVVGLLPLTEIRSALFGPKLVSSGFAVGGGPLADTPAIAAALAGEAVALAARLGCSSVELRGGDVPGSDWSSDSTSCWGSRVRWRPMTRRKWRLFRASSVRSCAGLALDLRIEVGRGARDRAAHYAVYAESVRNLGTPVFPRALFEAVLDGFGEHADILTVRSGDRPVAAVLSLYHGGSVMPYWGGGTAEARALRANDVMYFALMRRARERGCTRFDFGRSKAGSGAFAFKHNWGFEPQALVYHRYSLTREAPRALDPADARYARLVSLWKRLPLAVANRLGPWIARGLG